MKPKWPSIAVAFLVPEATLALRPRNAKSPMEWLWICVHRKNVCRSALNRGRHLARGIDLPLLLTFSLLFTSDCRQADHLPSLTPYYWSPKHFDVPSMRF
jgi:hypothetical protein